MLSASLPAIMGVGTGVGVGLTAFLNFRYKVSNPDQYLVRTGLGIKNIKVSKKGVQWPFQVAQFINMNPYSFQFNLHNMSKEKVEFSLPVVFTVAPIDPEVDENGFISFAQKMSNLSRSEIEMNVRGVIEGETRQATAKLSIEELFSQKDLFKQTVVMHVEEQLYKLGLRILNANIKEMKDYDENNKYFEYLKKNAVESANYEAQVAVGDARKVGEIGLKEKERDTRFEISRMDKETILMENRSKEEVILSITTLNEIEANAKKDIEISKIEAELKANERQTELEKLNEVYRQQLELETIRADELQSTKVKAESSIIQAEGNYESIKLIADADYYKALKKAEGNLLLFQAQADGLKELYSASGNNPQATKFYLSLKSGLVERLSEEQSNALQGLNPTISLWNTGSGSENNIVKSVQSIAPLIDGIQSHTNLNVPSWLSKSPSPSS